MLNRSIHAFHKVPPCHSWLTKLPPTVHNPTPWSEAVLMPPSRVITEKIQNDAD